MRLVILVILGTVLDKYNIVIVNNKVDGLVMIVGTLLAIAQDVKELFRK